jgi:hypothetical protein
VLHMRVIVITMDRLDRRMIAYTNGAYSLSSGAPIRTQPPQLVGTTQAPAPIGAGTQRR